MRKMRDYSGKPVSFVVDETSMKSTSDKVKLQVSREDRDLIRHHGYPFPSIESAMAAVPDSEDVAEVVCDRYCVELLLGDLARSINESTDSDLQEQLNDLYEYIESEMES